MPFNLRRRLRRQIRRLRGPMVSPRQRAIARFELYCLDLGGLRMLRPNLHTVAPGLLRSSQPSPRQIRRLADQGVRTIVNLRGASNSGAWLLERDACQRHGIALIDFPIKSRQAPEAETLLRLMALFGTLRGPVLFHCKSGADRAGLVAAAYLLWQGEDATEAMAQLSWRFGHIRHARTGVLDEAVLALSAMVPGGSDSLETRIRRHYDAGAVDTAFRPRLGGRLVADFLLRRE